MTMGGHNYNDFTENMQRCHDYIKALEEERSKIQVFQRELPLCLQLVTQAIETCKQQLSGTTTVTTEYNLRGQSECSEQTSSPVPIFEEFIPIKRTSSDSDGVEPKTNNESTCCKKEGKSSSCKKSDWLRSVQLWNQTTDPPPKEASSREFTESQVKKESGDGTATAPASTSSSAENSGGNKKEGQSHRKARRCWSPELHRRFLQALQQLGGSHVATPKQIRELMKVDGLTNDEVKSHLQKYRLHTRRPSPSSQSNNAQTPQFVVVGGLWVPPEYASMAANTKSTEEAGGASSKGIHVAPPPSPRQRREITPPSPDGGRSYSKGGAQLCSLATSSSTHTTPAVSSAC